MPNPPFTIKVHIAPGANPSGDAADWVWHDISVDVRHPGQDGGQAITVTAGRQDEGVRVDASTMSLTLDNRSGDYSTHNPLGAYYGDLRRNTPIRLGMVTAADTFTRTVAAGSWGTASDGQVWSDAHSMYSVDGSAGVVTLATANLASLNRLVGADAADFDAEVTVWSPVVATGAPHIFSIVGRYSSGTSYLLFSCELSTAGSISAKIRRVTASIAELANVEPLAFTYSANERIRVRAQADGPNLRLKIWQEADPEPDAWTATATDTEITGAQLGLSAWRYIGNTNAGSTSCYMDDFTVQSVEFIGGVTQWPVRWDMSANNCWAPIQAAGVLRRLQQGNGPLLSALSRQLPAYGPTGYWPLEDGTESATLASALSGGRPATYGFANPGGDQGPNGASSAVTFSAANGRIKGSTSRSTAGTGFSAIFFSKLSALPSTKTVLARFDSGAGRIRLWTVLLDATTVYLEGYEADGTKTVNMSGLVTPQVLTNWTAWHLRTEVVGANTNWALVSHQVGDAVDYSNSGSYASTVVSTVKRFIIGGLDLAGAAFCQVWIGPNTLPFADVEFSLVADGYAGELASDRITRLGNEEGIPVTIEPGTSEALGPQRQATILEALQSAADADYGILYERGTGLGFRPRSARYNQDVLMALAVDDGEISRPPEPINDDQRVRNHWKVDRENGSSATVYDQDHIDAEGLYTDSTTINVQTDAVLAAHAGWRLGLSMWPGLRWPSIVLDFARNPGLLTAWRSKGYGPRITVDTGLTQVAGSDPDVIVEGWTQTIHPRGWTADLNCSAAESWDVSIEGVGRFQANDSRLVAGINTTDLSWTVSHDGDLWTTDPAHFPVDIEIGGEVITLSGISGGASPQTFTTSARSVNGIVKAHLADAPVKVHKPLIVAL